MKKVLALVLSLVFMLSLAACGGGNGSSSGNTSENTTTENTTTEATLDKNDPSNYIGTWVSSYKLTEDYVSGEKAGDICNATIELYKGGTGKISWYNVTRGVDRGDSSLKWEIVDDVINVNCQYDNSTFGLEYNREKDALISVDGKDTYFRK